MDNKIIVSARYIKRVDKSIDPLKLSSLLAQVKYNLVFIANVAKQPDYNVFKKGV